ncbi:MAG: hypothetical protein AB1513_11430 [Pseudomonadota bacterium]
MAIALPIIAWDNRLSDATPAASSTATGYNVLNLRDFRPYTWWKPSAMPATVTVDCVSAKAADCCAVYGHDLGSKGATLEVRGSTDNFSASDVLVATVTPANDKPLLLLFTSASYRYWRLKVTGAAAPSLAIAALGARFTLPVKLPYGFDPVARAVRGQSNRSADGHPLGRVVTFEEWSATLTLQKVDMAWLRSDLLPLWKSHLRGKPFIFSWDSGDHADEIYLVQAGDKLSMPHSMPGRADVSFDISGVALA